MTHLDPIAALFRRHYRTRLSVTRIAPLTGWLALRSRIADLRRLYNMDIVNEQERVKGRTRSYYTYRGKLG